MHKIAFYKLDLFVRSLLFSMYALTSIVLYSFIIGFAFLFHLRYRHILVNQFQRAYIFMLKNICHISYKIEGLENIPKDRPCIVLSKHQSTFETFLLPLIFRDAAIVAKRELLWVPFFGWGLAASDPIFIDRRNKKSAMQQIIDKGKKCLEQGRYIIMFPEGTRTPIGQIGHYRLGGARLASATEYPVIPVAHNAGHFWRRRTFIKYPGTVHVMIGPVIESKHKTPEAIIGATKDWIESTVVHIESYIS